MKFNYFMIFNKNLTFFKFFFFFKISKFFKGNDIFLKVIRIIKNFSLKLFKIINIFFNFYN
jgi:hypothetical protein